MWKHSLELKYSWWDGGTVKQCSLCGKQNDGSLKNEKYNYRGPWGLSQ